MTLLLQLQVAATETPAMGAEFRRYAESRWLAQRCNPDPLHQQRTSLLHRLRQTVNDFPSSSGIGAAANEKIREEDTSLAHFAINLSRTLRSDPSDLLRSHQNCYDTSLL
ncbi:hypothetical protein MRB53_035509 [Persea americana]|uniref:Uncharacterized protein n=1 Tax=Persea americana TaxID=3435 RepID=A0ACC2K4V6_PERAE|nr:hypothetical protein MRB53_035509 [Persea americana]